MDLVIWSHSRGTKNPSYNRINIIGIPVFIKVLVKIYYMMSKLYEMVYLMFGQVFLWDQIRF